MHKFSSEDVAGIKPTGEYVLIRPDVQDKENEVKTASGLIIKSETALTGYKGPTTGTIKDISNKLVNNCPYKIGDRVMYEKLTELSVFIDDERFVLMKEETIYGVIE